MEQELAVAAAAAVLLSSCRQDNKLDETFIEFWAFREMLMPKTSKQRIEEWQRNTIQVCYDVCREFTNKSFSNKNF